MAFVEQVSMVLVDREKRDGRARGRNANARWKLYQPTPTLWQFRATLPIPGYDVLSPPEESNVKIVRVEADGRRKAKP
jgi:hypothetical protein